MSLFSNFPQSPDAEVKELINALESRVQAIEGLSGAAKIEVGSYEGTGVYGSSDPNIITFGFVPEFVLIMSYDSTGDHLVWISGSNSGAGTYGQCVVRVKGTTFEYYSPFDAAEQMNKELTYYYFGIGYAIE
jgi:hypothetical protein